MSGAILSRTLKVGTTIVKSGGGCESNDSPVRLQPSLHRSGPGNDRRGYRMGW
jgi:hypothetical protein